MATVYVNSEVVSLADGEQINCIQAARKANVDIPHYCWHPSLSVVASCRMCLVEVGEKKTDGTILMQAKLVPGCQTAVKDGTVIVTESEKVRSSQKATLEYLLLNHPLDCPVCDQAGECGLQDYSFTYGRGYSRLQEPKNQKSDKPHIGKDITLFTDRCIMCTRCVRFTREISGSSELQIVSRGSHEEIDIFPGIPCDNKLAGNVVDLCPVGALCSKDFLYRQRVWFLQTTDSVCPGCSTGCSIKVDQNKDAIYRIRPRHNSMSQGDFMCDDGRFGWKESQSCQRLTVPEIRKDGACYSQNWDEIISYCRNIADELGGSCFSQSCAMISPWATIEEAYLLSTWLRSISPSIKLAIGPVRNEGMNDCYPKDVRGVAVVRPKFTIRAEKCPNRKGVEHVLDAFDEAWLDANEVAALAATKQLKFLYVLGQDPDSAWLNERVQSFKNIACLIVQGSIQTRLTDLAHVVLAGGTFAEREGTFVNYAGLAQSIRRSVHTPGDARPDGRILWELAGRRGLFNVDDVLNEMSEQIPAFSRLKDKAIGEHGTFIKSEPEAN